MDYPSQNTLDFVQSFMQRLATADIKTWLCGGWAEELQGIIQPRPHHDIDLLYPAANFAHFDRWMTANSDLEPVYPKYFSHKRALRYRDVLVELWLLEPQSTGYTTNFFDGRYQLTWPEDTLSSVLFNGQGIPVAHAQALQLYCQHHRHIEQAYTAYVATQ